MSSVRTSLHGLPTCLTFVCYTYESPESTQNSIKSIRLSLPRVGREGGRERGDRGHLMHVNQDSSYMATCPVVPGILIPALILQLSLVFNF